MITTMDWVNENRSSPWRDSWWVRLVVISVLLLAASVPPYLDVDEPGPPTQPTADHPWLEAIRATHLLA